MATASKMQYVRYLPRCVRGQLTDDELRSVRQRIEQLPDVVGNRLNLHGLDVAPLRATRRPWWRLKIPPFRVFYLRMGEEIVVAEIDRRDDHTYADISRLDRYLLDRSGDGLRIVLPRAPSTEASSAKRSQPRRQTPAARREQQNPLTPFSEAELAALGLDEPTIKLVRTFGGGLDIAEELVGRGVEPVVVELVAGAWGLPTRALDIFAEGRVPLLEDLAVGEEELAERAANPDSATSLASLDDAAFHAILSGSVEEWMFYLHPSQARIVEAPATGPLRVRGGPGTGKTVAALHRGRWLATTGVARRVLVTTFVNVLPKVWAELFAAFAPEVHDRIETATVDALARRIVRDAAGVIDTVQDAERRRLLDRALADVPAARQALGGVFALSDEIDFVIAGRGLDAASYLTAARTGRGRALSPAQRAHVWAAYDRYTRLLARERKTDWAHLRAEALRLAREGHGPRFDAIIVDEAQDLTETHLRLLLALDADPEHRGLMLVGDGQQAIYPGGYSLRSVGVEVRGRSLLLRTNWRNTQLIAMAAEAVIGDLPFGDLDDSRGPRARGDAPLPRRLGEPATLHAVPTDSVADSVLAEVVADLLSRQRAGDVAILTGTNAEAERAMELLRPRPTLDLRKYSGGEVDAIRIGTYHRAKGLEFKAVVVLGATEQAYRRATWGLTEPDDIEEATANWTRTLFVAMTRARDDLVLIARQPLAPPVDDAQYAFDVEVW